MKAGRDAPQARTIAAAALGFGALAYAMLPAAVVPVGPDEFGYLKSIVQTVQFRRPWTDDFLEPWAASLSSLSALVFALTGSMKAAVHGLVAMLAALSFAGLSAVLATRLRARSAIGWAAVLLTFPPLLRRSLEYIDLTLYLPCFFWCLWAAERKRWGLFLALWCIAIADRQSALLWAIVPALAAVRQGFRPEPRAPHAWRRPALVSAVGAGWFIGVAALMNVSDIQLDRTARTFADFAFRPAFTAVLASVAICVLALGFARLLVPADFGAPAHRWGKTGLALIAAGALAVALFDPRRLVMMDTTYDFLYGFPGRVYATLLVAAAAAGWALGPFRLRGDLMLWLAASVGFVTLRQLVFDRYAIELAFIACFAVVLAGPPRETEASRAPPATYGAWPRVVPVILVLLGAAHLPFAVLTKVSIDRTAAAIVVYEDALRAGHIRPSEIAGAPFPFRAWHLHPYAVAHPLSNRRKLAGFHRFTEPTVELAETLPAWAVRGAAATAASDAASQRGIAERTERIAWIGEARYILVRRSPPAAANPLGRDYRTVPLPLNDREWRELIAGPPLR